MLALMRRQNLDGSVAARLFIRLRGQTLTNQTAPLIVSLIGGLIVIRLAWWEVNIRQLCTRRRNNKDGAAARVVIPPPPVCLERRMAATRGWPRSVFLQEQIWILNAVKTSSISNKVHAVKATRCLSFGVCWAFFSFLMWEFPKK